MTYRKLPLLDANGNYVDDFPLVLVGAMHYPECPRSIEHFRRIVGNDEDAKPGDRSQISKAVQVDVVSRKRQGHIVGQVLCRLIESLSEGHELSLNKAIYLAKRYAESRRVEQKDFKPRTTRGIRDALNNYRNVGHFWAAQVIFPEIFIEAAKGGEAFEEFIAVASDIRSDLEIIGALSDWQPWTVQASLLPLNRVLKVPPMSQEDDDWLAEYNAEIGR